MAQRHGPDLTPERWGRQRRVSDVWNGVWRLLDSLRTACRGSAALIPVVLLGRGEGVPPPLLQGARPMPSHCVPDAKRLLEWHL